MHKNVFAALLLINFSTIFAEPGVHCNDCNEIFCSGDNVAGVVFRSDDHEVFWEDIPDDVVEGALRIAREIMIDQIALEAWEDHIPRRYALNEVDDDQLIAFLELDEIEFEDSSASDKVNDDESQDQDEYMFISRSHVEENPSSEGVIAFHNPQVRKKHVALCKTTEESSRDQAWFYDCSRKQQRFDNSADGYIYIGRQLINNQQYYLFTLLTGYPAPSHWREGKAPKGLEKEPVTNISLDDVKAYADWINTISLRGRVFSSPQDVLAETERNSANSLKVLQTLDFLTLKEKAQNPY